WRVARRGAGVRAYLPSLRQQPHRRRARSLAYARGARGCRQPLLETGRKRPLVRGAVDGCDVRHRQPGGARARRQHVDSTGAFEMTTRAQSSVCAALAATALLLAGCGSKSETEVASGTYTDPETGKTADYKISSSEDGENGKVTIKTDDGEVQFGGEAKLPAGFTPFPG